jgi:hypothetical protein
MKQTEMEYLRSNLDAGGKNFIETIEAHGMDVFDWFGLLLQWERMSSKDQGTLKQMWQVIGD